MGGLFTKYLSLLTYYELSGFLAENGWFIWGNRQEIITNLDKAEKSITIPVIPNIKSSEEYIRAKYRKHQNKELNCPNLIKISDFEINVLNQEEEHKDIYNATNFDMQDKFIEFMMERVNFQGEYEQDYNRFLSKKGENLIMMEYLKQLDEDDVLKLYDILNENGFFVLDNLSEILKNGIQEKSDSIYFRCKISENHDQFENLAKHVLGKYFPNHMVSEYLIDRHRVIMQMNDFMVNRIFLDEYEDYNVNDFNLQKKFNEFMSEKFKDTYYSEDYEKFANDLNELEKEA